MHLKQLSYSKQLFSKIKSTFILLVVFSLTLLSFQSKAKNGYQIKIKFNDVTDSTILLCHYYGKASTVFIDDSTNLNHKGEATFKSDKKIEGGIYMILFKNRMTSMEIILLNGDDYSFEVSKNDIYNTAKFTGKTENNIFYDYQKYLTKYGMQYQMIESELGRAKTKNDSTAVNEKLIAKSHELIQYRNKFRDEHPNTFIAKLFNALEEPEIPKELPLKEDGSRDSTYPRTVYVANYWNTYDFKDDRLIYTPIYERKLDDYLTKFVIPIPDSVIKESDKLLKKAEHANETFKYTLWYLTRWSETSKIMGMDEVFVYLVENYYMKGRAFWVDSAQLAKYVERAQKIAPNMIGQPAMNLRVMDTSSTKNISLYDINADYTILMFWSPTCGHCKKEMPIFDSLYKKVLKKYNVKMFAFEADDETQKWKDFIKENKLSEGWIHVHDPNRTSNFRSFYDVYSTPTIYLLDDKKNHSRKTHQS
ncbi:MAG: alkyl hydroperoxide reductase [Bacteroidetes bacterium OLB11]|nr:MAG: alkyl hydroperoxide reductase [Bacteroidetes bacterium OLB11]